MAPLSLIITAKIAATIFLWAGPLLILPKGQLIARMHVSDAAIPMARLYGVAMAALCVGYLSAYWPISRGVYPWGVVLTGLASNGGAAAVLLITGAADRQRRSLVILLIMTTALAVSAVWPSWALNTM